MLAVPKPSPMHAPPPSPTLLWRLSLLGHRVVDVLRGARHTDLAALPLLRYAVIGFFGLATLQLLSGVAAPAPHTATRVATAGLFGAGGASATTAGVDADLAALERYRRPVARAANRLALDRTALEAAILLAARTRSDVDVAAFAKTLHDAAAARHATTHDAWVATAATAFPAPASAEAQLRHLIRRYGL